MSVPQYTTAAEFGDHGLPERALLGITTPQKDRALQWASRVADSYLSKRKVLPLLSWGEDLKDAVSNIAAYRLMGRRGNMPNQGNNSSLRDDYNAALAWLTLVSTGDTELVDCTDSNSDPTTEEATPLTASDPFVNFNFQTRCGPFGYDGGDDFG